MNKDARIFVAGHTGLVGTAMVNRLQRDGYKNILTATHHELDLTVPGAVDRFFDTERPEFVVLAAGKVGGIVENKTFPADFMNINLAIQYNVLRAAHRVDVLKLIFFASSCMYPRECPQPMAESELLSGKPEVTSIAYALSKLAGMQMCLSYNQQFGQQRFLPVIPNSIYGPHDNFDPQSGHVLSALIRRFHTAKKEGAKRVTLWGSGRPQREFVYVDDVVNACMFLLSENTNAMTFPMNIGGGTDISIRDLAEKIAGIIGYTEEIEWDVSKPDGAPRKFLDCSLIRSYGWKPVHSFDEGLSDTYKWYCDNVAKVELA